jgi:hypothetical protein
LNVGPHPYQVSRAQRCAERRFSSSLATGRGEVMRCSKRRPAPWSVVQITSGRTGRRTPRRARSVVRDRACDHGFTDSISALSACRRLLRPSGGMALSGPLEVKSPRQACATAHTPPAAAAREWRRSMRAHLRPPHPVRPPGVRVAAPLVNPQVRYRSAPFGRYRFRNIPKGIARNHITIPSWGRTKATGTESANSSTGDSDERSSHR